MINAINKCRQGMVLYTVSGFRLLRQPTTTCMQGKTMRRRKWRPKRVPTVCIGRYCPGNWRYQTMRLIFRGRPI